METYIGCMICGVRKDWAKFSCCLDEVRGSGLELVSAIKSDTVHIWYEAKVPPKDFYGEGLTTPA
jgi:hypothetical protein